MKKITLVFVLFASISFTNTVNAQDVFIGEVKMFAGTFAPRGWALCDGQLLAVSSNSALFSLLGTTYGGDGRSTFALPDLRGRVPIHAGTGPGLTSRSLGQRGGSETITVAKASLPSKPSKKLTNATLILTSSSDAQEVSIMQPYTTVNYIIALQGTYPSRN
jgi:microcystin-dependent protein